MSAPEAVVRWATGIATVASCVMAGACLLLLAELWAGKFDREG